MNTKKYALRDSVKSLLRNLVHSTQLDVFAAALIFTITIARDFHLTIYQAEAIHFLGYFAELSDALHSGAFP
ncbi:MAG: hypothetical protein AAF573_17890, partial [Bacteroidota bacterium]